MALANSNDFINVYIIDIYFPTSNVKGCLKHARYLSLEKKKPQKDFISL